MNRPWAGTSSTSRRRSTTRTTSLTSGTAYTLVAATSSPGTTGSAARACPFLTGTDEHGLNIQRARPKRQGSTHRHGSTRWRRGGRRSGRRLDIANDDYIRTTEPRHEKAVQRLLVGGPRERPGRHLSRDLRGPVLRVLRGILHGGRARRRHVSDPRAGRSSAFVEENYFFRLSAYADRLLEHYEDASDAPCSPRPGATRSSSLDPGRPAGLLDQPDELPTGGSRCPGTRTTCATSGSTRSPTTSPPAGYGTDEHRFAARCGPPDMHMIGKDILAVPRRDTGRRC